MKTNLKKISQLYTNMTLPVKASMWYLACSVLQKAIGFQFLRELWEQAILELFQCTIHGRPFLLSFAHFIYIMAYIITP